MRWTNSGPAYVFWYSSQTPLGPPTSRLYPWPSISTCDQFDELSMSPTPLYSRMKMWSLRSENSATGTSRRAPGGRCRPRRVPLVAEEQARARERARRGRLKERAAGHRVGDPADLRLAAAEHDRVPAHLEVTDRARSGERPAAVFGGPQEGRVACRSVGQRLDVAEIGRRPSAVHCRSSAGSDRLRRCCTAASPVSGGIRPELAAHAV